MRKVKNVSNVTFFAILSVYLYLSQQFFPFVFNLGVALGAALFAYLAAAQYRQENPHRRDWRYKRTESQPWGGSRSKSDR